MSTITIDDILNKMGGVTNQPHNELAKAANNIPVDIRNKIDTVKTTIEESGEDLKTKNLL